MGIGLADGRGGGDGIQPVISIGISIDATIREPEESRTEPSSSHPID